jgi:hypothetical protein
MALLDIMTNPSYAYVGRKDAADREKIRGAKPPVWATGTVVYVEFCGVIDGMDDRTGDMKLLAEERGLNFLGLRAEDVFDPRLVQRLGRTSQNPSQLFADLSHPGQSDDVVFCRTDLNSQTCQSPRRQHQLPRSTLFEICSHRFLPLPARLSYRASSITSLLWQPTHFPMFLICCSAKHHLDRPSGSSQEPHSAVGGLYLSNWPQPTRYLP